MLTCAVLFPSIPVIIAAHQGFVVTCWSRVHLVDGASLCQEWLCRATSPALFVEPRIDGSGGDMGNTSRGGGSSEDVLCEHKQSGDIIGLVTPKVS